LTPGTRTVAEARLSQLGHPLSPRRLPPATAQPSLPLAGWVSSLLTPLPAPAELRPSVEFWPLARLPPHRSHRHERERDDVGSRPLDPFPALFLFFSASRPSSPPISTTPSGAASSATRRSSTRSSAGSVTSAIPWRSTARRFVTRPA